MHDPVATETRALDEPRCLLSDVNDRVVVRGLGIEPRPALARTDRDILEEGKAIADARGNRIEKVGIERGLQARQVIGIRKADEEPGTFSANQHASVRVDA